MIVVVVNGYAFQVFGFKDLVTVQAADIIDPVTPCENLGARMLTIRHIEGDYPYSKRGERVVKLYIWVERRQMENLWDWPGPHFHPSRRHP